MDTRLKKYHQQLKIMVYFLDDEDLEDVMPSVEELIKKNGFENRKYSKASDLYQDLDETVHIAILDMNLPEGVTGIDVLKRIKEKHKDCFPIAYSGVKDGNVKEEWMNNDGRRWVDKNKSNSRDQLLLFIQQAIDFIKEDFDFHSFIVKELEKVKPKASL